MRTEFSPPSRPSRRCSISLPLPVGSAVILPRLRPQTQREHLKRPHLEPYLTSLGLYLPLRLLQQVNPLGSPNAGSEAQGSGSALAVRFVEAQDHTSPVLRPLEAPERELHALRRDEPVPGGLSPALSDDEGAVEREGFRRYPGFGPVPGVRKEAVGEAVLALIGERVRIEGAPKEADAEHVVPGAVAVLAVVQEGDPVARLGEVGEAVGRNLEAHLVPGGVAVGRAPDYAVHSLEGRFVGADVQGEERPQEHLPLVPLHARLDVQAPRAGEQLVCLRDVGPAEAALYAHRRAQWPGLLHAHALGGHPLPIGLAASFF